MKNALITYVLVVLHFMHPYSQTVVDLEIYYLPWNTHSEDIISEEDVRFYNKSKHICIQDSVTIDEFSKSMSALFLNPFPLLKKITHVMVIDIYYENGSRKTIGLNSRKNIVFQGIYYHMNLRLMTWLEKYVPPYKSQ